MTTRVLLFPGTRPGNAKREARNAERETRTRAATASSSGALAPNVILLPPSTVVVPFPAVAVGTRAGRESEQGEIGSVGANPPGPLCHLPTGPAPRSAGAATTPPTGKIIPFSAAQPLNPASDEAREDGSEGSRLIMFPAEADEGGANNIKVLDFRQPAEAKIIRLPVPAWANPPPQSEEDAAERLPGAAVTQLPDAAEPSEEFARLPATDHPAEESVATSEGVRKPVALAGLSRVLAPPAESAEATGITAARQDIRMDSLKNSEDGSAFAGRGQNRSEEFPPVSRESSESEVKAVDFSLGNSGAMDWQLGRPADSFDRPAPVFCAPLTPEQSATMERISSLMIRETSLVRQYSSDSMAVVLRPDENTELYVHFARRKGQLEATIRCDRGDAHQLGTLWPRLQHSLARQRVRLAPLQEGPSVHSTFSHAAGSGFSGDAGGSQRRPPSGRQFMDDRSAPASSSPGVSHVRGRGGSRRRLTTSRPGWETWA